LGILAATAISKYLDMGEDAVEKKAGGAVTELNYRERMKLLEWKIREKE
jgi:hypothetical protein